MIPTPLFIRTILSNWRFSRMMKSYDRRIAEARSKHRALFGKGGRMTHPFTIAGERRR